jgi:hypothetical protein
MTAVRWYQQLTVWIAASSQLKRAVMYDDQLAVESAAIVNRLVVDRYIR